MAYTDDNVLSMPVLALRDIVIFPNMSIHFAVGRQASVAALKYVLTHSEKIFLVAQRDVNEKEPNFDGLYHTGVICSVKQAYKLSEKDAKFRVVAEGLKRATLSEITATKPFLNAVISPCDDLPVADEPYHYEAALIRKTHEIFSEYCEISARTSENLYEKILSITDCGTLADAIAGEIFLPFEEKQQLLEELDPLKRLDHLLVLLMQELDILIYENEIHSKVQNRIDKSQREYFLREQLKTIHEQLDEWEDDAEESEEYTSRIMESHMPEESREKLLSEVKRFEKMSPGSPDANVVRTYLDKCLALPWGIYTKDVLTLSSARRVLDNDHYGLKDVKERIIEMLAARALSPDIKGQILCLAGPPGVGKTSIARSVAAAMHRNYARISLGGVRDEAEIRGHRRTYIGAIPGRIINALIDAKSANPLILLDEIDKLSGDFKGDPAAALLEVLDGEQNAAYCDHFIELPFDLSKVLFITTANDKYAIPEPLRDRMEIIDLGSYTHEEKFHIAKKHLIPKQLKEHNIDKKQLRFTDKAIRLMIDGYTKEAGVRQLERLIAKVARKSAVRFVDGFNEDIRVSDKNLSEFLGAVKFREDEMSHEDAIGLVNGLAWTSVGGEMLQIEVRILDGSGKLELTGSLGDVMKESARTAISLVRSKTEQFDIEKDFYNTKDIHIHVPEGAVPKDGPSAGITMTTALLSALACVPVKGNVAMTGEITLRGRVLPIGGLKEKAMAAYRHGITKVIIPFGNASDIDEMDEAVKNKITFVPVKTIDEVLSEAFDKKKNR